MVSKEEDKNIVKLYLSLYYLVYYYVETYDYD